jgi:hypothetical protein
VDQGAGLPHKLINVTIDYTSLAEKAYLGGWATRHGQHPIARPAPDHLIA